MLFQWFHSNTQRSSREVSIDNYHNDRVAWREWFVPQSWAFVINASAFCFIARKSDALDMFYDYWSLNRSMKLHEFSHKNLTRILNHMTQYLNKVLYCNLFIKQSLPYNKPIKFAKQILYQDIAHWLPISYFIMFCCSPCIEMFWLKAS